MMMMRLCRAVTGRGPAHAPRGGEPEHTLPWFGRHGGGGCREGQMGCGGSSLHLALQQLCGFGVVSAWWGNSPRTHLISRCVCRVAKTQLSCVLCWADSLSTRQTMSDSTETSCGGWGTVLLVLLPTGVLCWQLTSCCQILSSCSCGGVCELWDARKGPCLCVCAVRCQLCDYQQDILLLPIRETRHCDRDAPVKKKVKRPSGFGVENGGGDNSLAKLHIGAHNHSQFPVASHPTASANITQLTDQQI